MKRKSNYIEQMTQLEKAMQHELRQRKAEEERPLKRYDLDKIDLESEYAKIERKESYLSANKRRIVKEIVEARKFNNQVSELLAFDIEMHTQGVPSSGVLRSNTEARRRPPASRKDRTHEILPIPLPERDRRTRKGT